MRILTRIMVVFVICAALAALIATPAATPARAQGSCGTAPLPRLTVGQQGRVVVSSGVGNNLRSAAGSNSTVLGVMGDGEIFTVIAGPQCIGDNYNWWQVRRWDGQTGWTAEGIPNEYWVEPWPVNSPKMAVLEKPAADSSVIAYLSSAAPAAPQLFFMTRDGVRLNLLNNTLPNPNDPAWSPDGTRLVFTTGGSETVSNLAAMPMNGQPTVQLTAQNNLLQQPSWAPDGRQIAVTSSGGTSQILLVRTDAASVTALPIAATLSKVTDPDWSPDGRMIVFTGETSDGNSDIYVINADGTNQRQLTNAPTADHSPIWSPDGMLIVFISERDGNPELYSMSSADGSSPKRLTTSMGAEQDAVFSPDGQRIAFAAGVSTEIDTTELFSVRTDGTDLMQYTVDNGHAYSPTWSPDGQMIAFVSDRMTGNADIWLIEAGGGGLVNLTNSTAIELSPVWMPPTTTPVVIPGVTPGAPPAAGANPAQEDVLLIYDAGVPTFTLQNISGKPLNLFPLTFSGNGITVSTSIWQSDSLSSPMEAFMAGGCLQMWGFGLPNQPAPVECGTARQGWVTDNGTIFWTAGTFTVLYNNATVATCDSAAGRCIVDLP